MVDVSTADPLLGQILDGRYRLDSRIARGGMATVYAGVDTRLDRTVAVKVMHGELAADEEFVERFRGEAKAAAKLSHPNVVAVYDQGEDAGRVYLVMEHVAGRTLRGVLAERGRLDPATALDITAGMLEALAAAHDAGIVHRDVKPENVLVAPGDRVKVTDFGLARALTATSHTIHSGKLIGTMAYVAPEQVNSGAADARTDVYGAGIVLYEMLTGGPPYGGDTPVAVAVRHVNEDVPAPSAAVPGIPRLVDQVVLGATRRDPAERFADARTMLSAVRRARATVHDAPTSVIPLDDAPTIVTTLPPVPPPATAPKPETPLPATAAATRAEKRRRRRTVMAFVATFVLLVSAAAGWYVGAGRRIDAPKLEGLSLADAVTAAEKAGVKVREGEAVFDEDVPAGRIVDQEPDPGEPVRRGGTITVHLSKGVELVQVPQVVGRSEREARDRIALARLTVGRVTREYHDTIREGSVIRPSVKEGDRVRPGTTIDLVVSRGKQPVEMPDLVGKPLAEVDALLKQLGLGRNAAKTEYHDEVPRGAVIRQSPAKGTIVLKGTIIDVVVSLGPELVTVPDVVGDSRTDARRKLEAAGLVARFLDFPGRRGNRVVDQDPAAGSKVRKGTTVELYMF